MEYYSATELYLDILTKISEATGLPLEQLKCKRKYPAVMYRFMTFGYLVSIGLTHQYISEISGFSRETVTYGVKVANSGAETFIKKTFMKIIDEYNSKRS